MTTGRTENDRYCGDVLTPFQQRITQDVIKAVGNTELCELLDIERKAQCKVCMSYWDADFVYCTAENKKYISPFSISSLSRTFTSGKDDHTVTGTERKKVIKNTTLQVNSKRSVRNDN